MSTIMYIAPADVWHVPPQDRLEAAWTHFKTQINKFVEPLKPASDIPYLHFDPENVPEMTCPSCRHMHLGEAALDLLEPVYDRLTVDLDSPRSLDVNAPCCDAHLTLDAFELPVVRLRDVDGRELSEWKTYRATDWTSYRTAGFFRAGLCLWDHDHFLSVSERKDMARILGCPIQLVWHHF